MCIAGCWAPGPMTSPPTRNWRPHIKNLGQFDKAIWHAERALDQQPNDQATIGVIRELYRSHRNEAIDRLQLTASALAQQQIRNNRLQEALETLESALENQPERIDLRLLRARALWLDGQRMEAAETCPGCPGQACPTPSTPTAS